MNRSTYAHWRLLCRCLAIGEEQGAPPLGSALASPGFDAVRLADAANLDMLGPALHAALRRRNLGGDVPADLRDYLALLHQQNSVRNRRIKAQCEALGAILAARGIPAVLLKGTTWLFDDTPDAADDRMIRDIDLLVPRAALPEAVEALLAHGYRDSADTFPEEDHFHHPPLIPEEGEAVVELHRDLGYGIHDLPSEAMLAAAMPVAPGLSVPTVAHRALHNVLHAQLENADHVGAQVALRDLLDLARLMAKGGAADWAGQAGTRRLRQAMEDSLLLARRLLGAPPGGTPGWRSRLHAARCLASRRWPPLGAAGQRLAVLSRGLRWERDAYVPSNVAASQLERRGAVIGRLVRRLQRTAARNRG